MLQFLSEAPLITGDELASAIGLSAGTSQFNKEPWLHFNDNGKEIYIAKKPFKHSISWDDVFAASSIYGNKTITIDNKEYLVRLLRGGNADPTINEFNNGYNTTEHQGSEWNRYLYPIHSTTHVNSSNPNTSDMGTLAQYTDEQLHLHGKYSNGPYNWCQEVFGGNASGRVVRGGSGVTYSDNVTSSPIDTYLGWRPVLELINL